jgi:hypothetical protein
MPAPVGLGTACGYASTSPRMAVAAWPSRSTRSPWTRTCTPPPRFDTWCLTSSVLPRRLAQNGPRQQWAVPVTRSSQITVPTHATDDQIVEAAKKDFAAIVGDKPLKRTIVVKGRLVNLVCAIISAFPTFGIRRLRAHLKHRLRSAVKLKKVARMVRHSGRYVHKRRKGGRPRALASRSVAERPDERWATDVALVAVGTALELRAPSTLNAPGVKPRAGEVAS